MAVAPVLVISDIWQQDEMMDLQSPRLSIEHLALWSEDIERLRQFYERYLGAQAGGLYRSKNQPLISYFLTFCGGARLEIMTSPQLDARPTGRRVGLAHFALRVGSREHVDQLVERLRLEKVEIAGEPRLTGDGYYEAIILDPDGNSIELVA
jgi:lactoylglutathione lyase